MAKRPRRKPFPLRLLTSGPPGFWWTRIGEHPDPRVVRQQHELYCIPACLQMLFGNSLTHDQPTLANRLRMDPILGINPDHVLPVLRELEPSSRWTDDHFPTGADLRTLRNLNPLLAFLVTRERPPWHAVIVDDIDAHAQLHLRDPLTATAYAMDSLDFDQAWSGYAIFRAPPPARRKRKPNGN